MPFVACYGRMKRGFGPWQAYDRLTSGVMSKGTVTPRVEVKKQRNEIKRHCWWRRVLRRGTPSELSKVAQERALSVAGPQRRNENQETKTPSKDRLG